MANRSTCATYIRYATIRELQHSLRSLRDWEAHARTEGERQKVKHWADAVEARLRSLRNRKRTA